MASLGLKLARLSGVLGFGVVGIGFFYRNHFSKEFKRFPYYDRGVELLKGYEPAIEKLGDKDKLKFQEIEITDTFNYNDGSIGRVKIPVVGPLRKADLLVYARKEKGEKDWWIEKLEIYYTGSGIKYQFYDGSFNKPFNLDTETPDTDNQLEFVSKK